MIDKFEEQRKQDQQTLFREREVQNLRDLIYGKIDSAATTDYEEEQPLDDSLIVDTNRYDVHPSKLEFYLQPDVKKLLKSKFVTGQSQEQIMKNLLNMSDSDEEEDAKLRKRAGKRNQPEGGDDHDEEAGGSGSESEEEKKPS